MDRRLPESTERIRFRVNATRCDGQGVCAIVAPEVFRLDRYGYAYVVPGSEAVVAADDEIRARAFEADVTCPRNAIFEELSHSRPAPAGAEPIITATPARLLADTPETPQGWRDQGGFAAAEGPDIARIVSEAGVLGQGGAAFPTAAKWQRLSGTSAPVLIVNGSEREPGTLKDRYLLRMRPGLVLDGVALASSATGASEVHVGIDEESAAEALAFTQALAEARAAGLFCDAPVTVHRVPASYVAGEETALISFIGSGRGVPWLRPPFPTQTGLAGRPTLVHNVETLAQVALAVRLGVREFRSVGTKEAPGTGLFSIGRFGGPFALTERPYGYPLRQMLAEAGFTGGIRGVLVGGYGGALLSPDALDVALTPGALALRGASLGTKSVQVIGLDDCPVDVTAQVVEYLAGQTAGQCPPCSRGLPDIARSIRQLENSGQGDIPLGDVESYMRTLFDRGVCRLPDGAARVTLSLFKAFSGDVRRHVTGGCPRWR